MTLNENSPHENFLRTPLIKCTYNTTYCCHFFSL